MEAVYTFIEIISTIMGLSILGIMIIAIAWGET